jgi:DNA-binding CsgD family transcriptional regulator
MLLLRLPHIHRTWETLPTCVFRRAYAVSFKYLGPEALHTAVTAVQGKAYGIASSPRPRHPPYEKCSQETREPTEKRSTTTLLKHHSEDLGMQAVSATPAKVSGIWTCSRSQNSPHRVAAHSLQAGRSGDGMLQSRNTHNGRQSFSSTSAALVVADTETEKTLVKDLYRRGLAYTETEKTLVKCLYRQGKTTAEIGAVLKQNGGLSPDLGRIRRLLPARSTVARVTVACAPESRGRMPWTPSEANKVKELSAKGMTAKTIANELGRSLNSVWSYKYRDHAYHGSRRWTEDDNNLLKQMVSVSTGTADIAERLRRTGNAVIKQKWVIIGKVQKYHKWSESETQKIVELWREGLTDQAIADRLPFQVEACDIRGQRHKLGLVSYSKRKCNAWTTNE